jgi:hypothetical protein
MARGHTPSTRFDIVPGVRRLALLGFVLLAAALAGCGTSDDRDQARSVVERFYEAVREDDGVGACAQLSDATVEQLEGQTQQSCDSVITRLEFEGGAIVRTEVFVTNAKVDLRSGESTFLSRDPTGWKISALACQPIGGRPSDQPYDCEVEA